MGSSEQLAACMALAEEKPGSWGRVHTQAGAVESVTCWKLDAFVARRAPQAGFVESRGGGPEEGPATEDVPPAQPGTARATWICCLHCTAWAKWI